jgi:hypothetical protein
MITKLPACHVADHPLQRHDDLNGDISDEHPGLGRHLAGSEGHIEGEDTYEDGHAPL